MHKIDYKYHDFIVKIEFIGKISVKEVLDIAEELTTKMKVAKILLLTDIRKATYSWDVDDVKFLNDRLVQIIDQKVTNYEATLINNPEEYAKTTMFIEERNRKNHITKIFTTEVAALQWLSNYT